MRGSTNAQDIKRTSTAISFRDMGKERGTTPTSDKWTNIIIEDKNGTVIGQLSQIMFPDGAVRTAMGVNRETSNNTFLCLQMNADGTVHIFVEKTVNGVYSTTPIVSF